MRAIFYRLEVVGRDYLGPFTESYENDRFTCGSGKDVQRLWDERLSFNRAITSAYLSCHYSDTGELIERTTLRRGGASC